MWPVRALCLCRHVSYLCSSVFICGFNTYVFDYLIRRLIGTVPVLLAVSAFVFLFVHLLPGDPARLIDLFSVRLGWLPTGGYGTWQNFVLPAFTLGTAVAAVMARFTRSAFVEITAEDYVRTARAKGVPERGVVWKHTLRNALIPVI